MTTRTTTSGRERLISELEQITDSVGTDDLTTSELAALVALLSRAYVRVLAGNRPPVLRVVRDDI